MAEVAARKVALQEHEEARRRYEKAFNDVLAVIPNPPADDVPVGPDERANVIHREWGKKPPVHRAKEHFELGEALGRWTSRRRRSSPAPASWC